MSYLDKLRERLEAPVEYDEPEYCPACMGLLFPEGTIGTTDHYRCRSCGLGFHITRSAK